MRPHLTRQHADRVIEQHASAFEVPVWRLMLMQRKPRKEPALVRCRWAIWYALRREGYAYKDIAEAFGSHHTTIINGIERIITWPPPRWNGAVCIGLE